MNVFISGPALTSAENMLSVWDWGGGRTPFFVFFCFCFEDFKLRIKNETQNIAINHNLWSFFFLLLFWENWFYFFSNSKKMVYGIYNIFFLSYTWQSVGFLLHVIHMGVYFLPMCSWVLTEWPHTGGVEL